MTFTQALATNNYGPAKFIVSSNPANGTHTTIQSAINSASSGDTIFLRPGTYTENPALVAGVNLTAYNCDAITPNVIINGKCTFSAAGTVSISGIQLQTNSDFCLAVTGSAASIVYLINCYINCPNNTGISFTSSNSSAQINVNTFTANLGTTGIGLYTSSSTGSITFRYGSLFNTGGSTTASSNSAGSATWAFCGLFHALSCSSTGTIAGFFTSFNPSSVNTTAITTAGTGISIFHSSEFNAGTASAISIGAGTTVNLQESCTVTSSNTNALTGAGTLNAGLVVYGGSSSGNNVTTANSYSTFPGQLFSWTPVIKGSSTAGTATYTAQLASYAVFGRMVFFICHVTWNSGTGTGNLLIDGLPFTSNATNYNGTSAARLDSVSLPASTVNLIAQVNVNAKTIGFAGATIAGSPTAVAYSAAGDGYVSGFYFI